MPRRVVVQRQTLDSGLLLGGTVLGLGVGALVALLSAPISGDALRARLSGSWTSTTGRVRDALPTISDPVADSLAEGRAAARRNLSQELR